MRFFEGFQTIFRHFNSIPLLLQNGFQCVSAGRFIIDDQDSTWHNHSLFQRVFYMNNGTYRVMPAPAPRRTARSFFLIRYCHYPAVSNFIIFILHLAGDRHHRGAFRSYPPIPASLWVYSYSHSCRQPDKIHGHPPLPAPLTR